MTAVQDDAVFVNFPQADCNKDIDNTGTKSEKNGT